MTVAAKITNDPPEPFAAQLRYAPMLDEHLIKAMSKDPDVRFESCAELGDRVTELLLLRTTLSGDALRSFTETNRGSQTSHAVSLPPPATKPGGLKWFVVGVLALITAGVLVRTMITPKEAPRPAAADSAEPSAEPEKSPTTSASANRLRRTVAPKPIPMPPPTSKPGEEPTPTSTVTAPPASPTTVPTP